MPINKDTRNKKKFGYLLLLSPLGIVSIIDNWKSQYHVGLYNTQPWVKTHKSKITLIGA